MEGEWSEVILVYNKFKNAATQITTSERILPITISEITNTETSSRKDYIFEPGKAEIINSLIPQQVHPQVFEAILNSIAS